MDADGNNQRELEPIPEMTWYDNRKVTLDWPAGDWIYYRKTNTSIWRYNIKTDKDELFIEYGNDNSFRKWACNLTVDRISVQDGMCNMLHHYPLGNFKFGASCDPGGCNVSISASGRRIISKQANSTGMRAIHTQSLPAGFYMVAVKGNGCQAARIFAIDR